MLKRVIFTIFLTVIIYSNFATSLRGDNHSSYKLEQINEDYGFLQNSVTDIKQDHLGYMWYSTPNGLYRYDGYNFTIYYNEPNDTSTIEGNFITDIAQWFDGEYCFSKNNMINIFDTEKENFYRIDTSKSGDNFNVIDIVADQKNPDIAWLLSTSQLLILKLSEDHQTIASVLEAKSGPYNKMICDKSGNVWLTSKNKVSCYRYDSQHGITLLFEQKIADLSQIAEGDSGEIYLYSPSLITEIREQNGKFEVSDFKLEYQGNKILLDNILISPDGDLIGLDWDRGIYTIDLESHQITYGSIVSDGDLNKNFRYNTSYIDSSYVLWVGTRHGGLYKINLKQKRFNAINGIDELLYTNQITGDKDGNIYIGTHYHGIKHTNIFREQLSNKDLNRGLKISNDESIFALIYVDGYLWYTTTDGSICRAKCSPKGEVISQELIANVTSGLGFFYRGDSGRLYYSIFTTTSNKRDVIFFCDNSSATHPLFQPISTICNPTLSLDGVTALMEDQYGSLWIGSSNSGLLRITIDGSNIKESIDLPSDTARNSIFSIYKDSANRLYVGTFGGGLVVIEEGEPMEDYSYYTRANGLANNAIYSIEDGGDGSLWISTDEGLSRFDTESKTFQNYDTTDGILSTNFRKWSSWRCPSGTLFFGGVKGVNYFVSEQIKENSYLPEIQITDLKVAGKDRNFVEYTYKSDGTKAATHESITLAPNERDIRIEFASLHFENPEKSHYQYMLRGVDSDWNNATSKNRSVNYSNLSPGEYEFLVRGTNSDGIWSKEYAGLSIVIKPYWWQSWYAKIAYLIIAIIVAYMLYIFMTLRNRHRMDNRLNQAKLDFFTNISHEIKTPLTIISGLLDLNSGNDVVSNKDIEIIRRNNKRMLALVTQLLDFRKVTHGHAPFNPIKEDIVPVMNSISESFMTLASKNGIEYHFDNELTSKELFFEADKIEKIVANLLSNAFKYTPQDDGVIELSLRAGVPEVMPKYISKKISNSDHYITIAVKDNGDGIAPEHIDKIFERFYQAGKYDLSLKNRGVGVGLAYSKLLTELHEGEIYVESQQGEGSTFYLILPEKLKKVKINEVKQNVESRESIEFLLESKGAIATQPQIVDEGTKERELLIVEDNQEIREFLREVLSPLYKIHEAANGLEGLEIAERVIPDIIISDVMMPEMDGITLCNKLKTGSKTDHIPIILLTANSTIDHRVEGIRSGADSYIPKPFNMEHLKVRIEKLLEMRTLLKNKYMQQSGYVDLQNIDINSVDKEFLTSVEKVIEDNLDDSEFTVERLEELMKYSHMQLYRKMKTISGISAVEYIRNYRLKRSVDMMHQGHTRINEIMYAVGFATPSYFSKSFKKRYGKSPVEFIEELHKEHK